MRRFVLIALVLPMLPPLAAAQTPSTACIIELNGVDDSFDETHARLKDADGGDIVKKCSAVAHHIDVLRKGVEVYLRCIPPGPDRDMTVASLSATIVDFRGIHTGLKCADELVPARFTPIPRAGSMPPWHASR
jgi:hypothetical protein